MRYSFIFPVAILAGSQIALALPTQAATKGMTVDNSLATGPQPDTQDFPQDKITPDVKTPAISEHENARSNFEPKHHGEGHGKPHGEHGGGHRGEEHQHHGEGHGKPHGNNGGGHRGEEHQHHGEHRQRKGEQHDTHTGKAPGAGNSDSALPVPHDSSAVDKLEHNGATNVVGHAVAVDKSQAQDSAPEETKAKLGASKQGQHGGEGDRSPGGDVNQLEGQQQHREGGQQGAY